jgi:hypothetical protein
MERIEFNYNWNQKLNCRSFSTVRIENPKKYILNQECQVVLKQAGNRPEIMLGIARIKYITNFLLYAVNPGISYLDANLSPDDYKIMVLKMYKNANIDFHTHRLSFIIFQYIPIKEPERTQI